MKMSEMSISDILDAYVATILACGNADAQGHKIIRRAIEKRLARLAALVEKLPKTADGMVITIGMKVYVPSMTEGWVSVTVLGIFRLHGTLWVDISAGSKTEPAACYSTYKAAKAAQKENDNDEA